MSIKAVIFDVYSTILEVGPAPGDAEIRWRRLFEKTFGTQPRWSRLEFFAACSQVIAQRHDHARARGIRWPEIQWPSVVAELLPEFTKLKDAKRDEFIEQHIQTGRTLAIHPESITVLKWLRRQGAPMGIASNSQAYTLRELTEAIRSHGLDLGVWASDLCFWSFQHGFSKPDPHVFQLLTARLESRGIAPAEILMVGDRIDNDMAPARAFGWQTWLLAPTPTEASSGPWLDLLAHLQMVISLNKCNE